MNSGKEVSVSVVGRYGTYLRKILMLKFRMG